MLIGDNKTEAPSEIDSAAETTGFIKCIFGPSDEECERCDAPKRQLYWRCVDGISREGEYFCAECVIKESKEFPRFSLK